MPVRNGAIYFAGSKLLDMMLGSGDVAVDGSIGLYVEVGGYVKFDCYTAEVGWVTDEFLVGDKSYIPGMIRKVYAVPDRGAIATGIHALK